MATSNRTPKVDGDSPEIQLHEELFVFLDREKLQAQKCIHDCEKMLNCQHLKSQSAKEALQSLRSSTEESYGHLLHLEQLLAMDNYGDRKAEQHNHNQTSVSSSGLLFSSSSASVQVRNNSKPQNYGIAASVPASAMMFSPLSNGSRNNGIFQKEPSVEEDEVEVGLDPLEQMDDFQELMFASHDDVKEQNQNGDSGNKEASAVHGEIDDFDEDSGLPPEAAYKSREITERKSNLMMAKSLPMRVPMPDPKAVRFGIGNKAEDNLDKEELQNIPKKIAEIAKSLHVDELGELPSPPRQSDF